MILRRNKALRLRIVKIIWGIKIPANPIKPFGTITMLYKTIGIWIFNYLYRGFVSFILNLSMVMKKIISNPQIHEMSATDALDTGLVGYPVGRISG
jgi:hypothetical protein